MKVYRVWLLISKKHAFFQPPETSFAQTLNCSIGSLPVIYLEIPISGRRPRRQGWKILITKVWKKISAWKTNSCLWVVD